MKLILLRHGEAGFDAPCDEERALTVNGIGRLQFMLHSAADELSGLRRVVHSPYLRTQQTAALVKGVVAQASLEPLELLVPESRPQAVIDWLTRQSSDVLLLVTHQPLIGMLVSLLCEGDLSRPEAMLPGAMAVIDLEFPAAGLGRLLKQY
ncbi:MAG: phosphohistidine phosphatase SixA [Amphritea sp.]